MEQPYIIEKCDSFEPKDIFECGQCFRWDLQEDGSYTGVFDKNVLNVKKDSNKIVITGICNGNIEEICREYFDLDRDYEDIKKRLSKIDDNMKISTEYGKGIRLLNQDLWETIISFITSANNNIPRIKGILKRLSEKYGEEIVYKGKKYYSFPTPEALGKASIEDLRKIGLGFRDKYIYKTTKMINEGKFDLEELFKESDTAKVRAKLISLQGIGPKVADCILLFSKLKRLDVFPIDVWVRRVINELYIHNPDESKVNKKDIENIAKDKFGDMRGIAQQYLFYWKREN